jgi:hypothetical protein
VRKFGSIRISDDAPGRNELRRGAPNLAAKAGKTTGVCDPKSGGIIRSDDPHARDPASQRLGK